MILYFKISIIDLLNINNYYFEQVVHVSHVYHKNESED